MVFETRRRVCRIGPALPVGRTARLPRFAVLYALSALHVMPELPLDHQSFAALAREAVRLAAPAQLAAGPAASAAKAMRRRARRE